MAANVKHECNEENGIVILKLGTIIQRLGGIFKKVIKN